VATFKVDVELFTLSRFYTYLLTACISSGDRTAHAWYWYITAMISNVVLLKFCSYEND